LILENSSKETFLLTFENACLQQARVTISRVFEALSQMHFRGSQDTQGGGTPKVEKNMRVKPHA